MIRYDKMTLSVRVECTLSECLWGKTDSLCIHITSVSGAPQGTLVIKTTKISRDAIFSLVLDFLIDDKWIEHIFVHITLCGSAWPGQDDNVCCHIDALYLPIDAVYNRGDGGSVKSSISDQTWGTSVMALFKINLHNYCLRVHQNFLCRSFKNLAFYNFVLTSSSSLMTPFPLDGAKQRGWSLNPFKSL